MCDQSDSGPFTFNFSTNSDVDKATAGVTDSHTCSGMDKATSSMTADGVDGTSTTDVVDRTTTTGGGDSHTAFCFGSSTEGTPFHFNFESS